MNGAGQRISAPTIAVYPDSLTGVIAQTQSHLDDIESKLNIILNRVNLAPDEKKDANTARIDPSGILAAANQLRNTACRIMDACTHIDNLL